MTYSKYKIDFSEYVYYDDTSPTCLRWIKSTKATKAGGVAGSKPRRDGYMKVQICKKSYYVHRVVYLLFNDLQDTSEIDHINGDQTDNRISNLRISDRKRNTRNRKKSKNNTTGLTGVIYEKSGYWRACWYDESGKYRRKAYSVSKFGFDKARELATQKRDCEISKLEHYTERHGK